MCRSNHTKNTVVHNHARADNEELYTNNQQYTTIDRCETLVSPLSMCTVETPLALALEVVACQGE